MTKNLPALAAALLLIPTASYAACPQAQASREQRATIPLQNLGLEGPLYYWHDQSTYALLYFRPADLVARLEALLAHETGSNRDSFFGDATLAPALLDNIKVDLPLKESTDLFRYTLIDPRFDTVMNTVIADLLQDGRVMLDQWIFNEHPAKSIVMISRTGADGAEGGRWFCTASNEVLFRTGHQALN